MKLNNDEVGRATARLEETLATFARRFPGDSPARQPVHTVYGGAHLFKSDTPKKLGALALRSLNEYGKDPHEFARVLGIPDALAELVYRRVVAKLEREAVEDFRIDFEDGYGNRPDEEEDGHAASAAREVAAGLKAGSLSPFIGIRVKPYTQELMRRSIRTMDIFISTLLESAGQLPPWFVVTLPKIQLPEQVTALADIFDALSPRTLERTTTPRAATSPRRISGWITPCATSRGT
jgi:hypothetical protein